jgi:uncharacterized protein (DUF849 family)
MAAKAIISCAITGGLHTPTMSNFLPLTPADIAQQAIDAAKAGAAIVHLHARNPEDGRPTASPDVFMQFLPRIHAETDAVINITTGGAPGMTLEERIAAAMHVSPELASLNMGTMCFALFPVVERFAQWKYEWEPKYLAATEDLVFKNTYKDIRYIVEKLRAGGTRFEFECYDLSHLYNLAWAADQKLIEPPFMIQTIYGVMGGIGADPANLHFMKSTADRLFGKDFVWSLFGVGRHQMPICTMGALMGASVRVGLEDSLSISRGQLATSNAEQVLKIRRILAELSIDIATPDEARKMLALKGRGETRIAA